MRWLLRPTLGTALGLGVCCGAHWTAQPCSAQSAYRVLDLGTVNGNGTFGRAVNNIGQVAGFSSGSAGPDQAFRTGPDAPVSSATDNLGTVGGDYSQAYGLNDSGQAVGLSGILGSTLYHAFRTAPNGMLSMSEDLGTLSGSPGNYSQAFAVNVHGQVVGVSDTSPGDESWPAHAFRTAPNLPIDPLTDDLGTFGGSYSEARDINAAGQAVGSAYFADERIYHAFRTAANAAINRATDDLGTLGGSKSTAIAINDSGVVAGSSLISGDVIWHAFRVAAGRPINPATDDLGTLGGPSSRSADINASGKVVGFSDIPGGTRHAFLFDGTTMYDLNGLIDSASGWVLVEAWSINDNCQITGKGQMVGSTMSHAFLLSPISGNCEIPDLCPADPLKRFPGQCGCGVPDIDSDGDHVPDCLDACPQTPKGIVTDAVGCPDTVTSDFNRDHAVDKADFDYFVSCAKGPGIPQDDPNCAKARLDSDDDVDADDFAIFQRCVTFGASLNLGCGG